MNPQEKDILRVFHSFWQTWADRNHLQDTIHDLTPFFDADITSIGTGNHESGRDLEEVIRNFQDDLNELLSPVQMEFHYEHAKMLSADVGLVEANVTLGIDIPDQPMLQFDLRITSVLVMRGDKWVINHNHVSIPSDGQDLGQAYPIDELKAKNEKLQREVNERTRKLEERGKQLQAEKEKTEQLLYNILPVKVARELMENGHTKPSRFEEVSVLFTDFTGFSDLSSRIRPGKLVEELNDIFHAFDKIIEAEHLEKIKTIGDAYMAVCGVPEPIDDHAGRCIRAARQMCDYLKQRNKNHEISWNMRIGIHSGPVVAGVVGSHKFSYDLWGDTVNIASRMESAGAAGRINISDSTYHLIKGRYECEHRGQAKLKGIRMMDMYFVS